MNQRSEKEKKHIDNIFAELGLEPPPSTSNFTSLKKEAKIQYEKTGQTTEKLNSFKKCPVSGKTCFPSQANAEQRAKRRKELGAGTGFLRVYQCPDCHEYHLTSAKPQKHKRT